MYMYGLDMEKAAKAVEKIGEAYDADRYVDIDGLVWLGSVDGCWVMEEDSHYWLTHSQMHKKMINELMDYEQERRDAAARIEALYEYGIQRSASGTSTIVGENWGPRGEVNMGLLKLTTGSVEYTLVRRRKAGPVEEVAE